MKPHLPLILVPNIQVERKEMISVLGFCPVLEVQFYVIGFHYAQVLTPLFYAMLCEDCVQKSNEMGHVPPTSHFQDAFSLSDINRYPQSKFSFSEPKACLFFQTLGKLSISLLSCVFVLSLNMETQA